MTKRALPLGLALAAVLLPSRASAYLMDANDARVIEPGTLEFELQPIGYYQILSEENEHYLISPSIMGYVGITHDVDFIYLTRGYAYLDYTQDSEQPFYRTYEAQMGFRILLLRGAYSTDCTDGPSIVLQPQILLPNLNAPGEVPGFSLALLLAQQWEEWGTIHANIWWNRNADQTWGTFGAVAMEGPPNWDVRPLVEVTYWYDEGFGSLLSGTAGTYIDIGDDFTWELGARLGGWEDYAELEVRVSMWMDAPLHASLSDAEEDPCHGKGDGDEPSDENVDPPASGATGGSDESTDAPPPAPVDEGEALPAEGTSDAAPGPSARTPGSMGFGRLAL